MAKGISEKTFFKHYYSNKKFGQIVLKSIEIFNLHLHINAKNVKL